MDAGIRSIASLWIPELLQELSELFSELLENSALGLPNVIDAHPQIEGNVGR